MTLTPTLLHQLFPDASPDDCAQHASHLDAAMREFHITTPAQWAMFLAQCCWTSHYFTRTEEPLRYFSAPLLRAAFPQFRKTDPAPYLWKPDKLANYVYAGKLGNSDEASG